MPTQVSDKMTPAERRAGSTLAAIFALRMLGLFLILPVFSAHAHLYAGGDNLTWVGIAIGAYGLTQAVLQVPFGIASDRFGRKPVIVAGLVLFILGSAVAALADSIQMVVAGRVLQGAGAISAAVTALAADLTREQHRTKVMAMIGSSIALMFALSMVAAPLLYPIIGMGGLFWLTAALALMAIVVVVKVVPEAPQLPRPKSTGLVSVLRQAQLMRLNLGVFVLHLIQTTMWVLVPAALVNAAGLAVPEHWKIYLPAVLLSFVVMVPAIIAAEKRGKMKQVFNSAIVMLLVVQCGLLWAGHSAYTLLLWLTLFFIAFNILEATQPSWISRIAAPESKGVALGVYNTLQSLGLFCGGMLGGLLGQYFGPSAVHLSCAALAGLWLWVSAGLQAPPLRVAQSDRAA